MHKYKLLLRRPALLLSTVNSWVKKTPVVLETGLVIGCWLEAQPETPKPQMKVVSL
jgi:hypothetical protein